MVLFFTFSPLIWFFFPAYGGVKIVDSGGAECKHNFWSVSLDTFNREFCGCVSWYSILAIPETLINTHLEPKRLYNNKLFGSDSCLQNDNNHQRGTYNHHVCEARWHALAQWWYANTQLFWFFHNTVYCCSFQQWQPIHSTSIQS